VSVRGIVNDTAGVIELGSTPDWNGVPIEDYLESRIGCSVWVENNVRAAALAEYTYGGAEIHNSHCMLLVRVDEGVGMGIMLDGKLYRGPHRSSGEFGQMVIADSPGAGAHDRPGCLELLAANPAILARYAALKPGGVRTLRGEPESKVRTICHRAVDGDPHATLAIRECMRYLGIGIANVVWGLDPDVVLIHGAITEAWPVVLSAIQEQFPAGREFSNFRDLILRPCALGQDAGMTGAITLPFVRLFATGQTEETRRPSAAVSM
jgi:predicted NBD/HSP70 family sugar kinase